MSDVTQLLQAIAQGDRKAAAATARQDEIQILPGAEMQFLDDRQLQEHGHDVVGQGVEQGPEHVVAPDPERHEVRLENDRLLDGVGSVQRAVGEVVAQDGVGELVRRVVVVSLRETGLITRSVMATRVSPGFAGRRSGSSGARG